LSYVSFLADQKNYRKQQSFIDEFSVLRCESVLKTHGSAWYSDISLTAILLMAAMAFQSFYTSLSGRPVFGVRGVSSAQKQPICRGVQILAARISHLSHDGDDRKLTIRLMSVTAVSQPSCAGLPGTPVTHDQSWTHEIITLCGDPATPKNCLTPPRILGDNPDSI
jgi:hypothetical protein